jgi:excisionase family DNA binding protein
VYLTLKETADYLSVSVTYVENLISQGKIRVVHDGEGVVLVYKEQFKTHFEQLEKYKMLVEELANEPIPEDKDIKDED